jgi:hypothetical protein
MSPAMAAMRGGTGASAAPAATPPRTDLITPTQVDTSKQDQLYGQQMADYQKGWDTLQAQNTANWERMQRANGTNAAMMGMSIGGGSYLAGQRQAGIAATNANNQATLDWLKGRAGMTGDAANRAAGAANTNANLGQQASIFNAGREGDVQDRTADAATTRTGQNIESDVSSFNGSLKQYGIDVADITNSHGATNAIAANLVKTLQGAEPGSQAYQDALARMEAYKAKLAQAKQQWQAGGGEIRYGTLENYLKDLEKNQGFFNGI